MAVKQNEMRKAIAFINVTLDGYCDHTAMIADTDLHEHVNELFRSADTVLFGRKTFQLMESSWPIIVEKPVENKAMDEFAVLIDNIPKVVFSRTLKKVDWKNTTLIHNNIQNEIIMMKEGSGKNILVGSPSIIIELMKLGLIDEYQFCIHPIILGSGLPLFKNIEDKIELKLFKTKTFSSGAVVHYYKINQNK